MTIAIGLETALGHATAVALVGVGLMLPCRAFADDGTGYVPGMPMRHSLGLSPYAPQGVPALPGGVTPPSGAPVASDSWQFDFHGYMQAPLRAGLSRRDDPNPDQHALQLHTPPLVPGEYGYFDYTGAVPQPWVQLNFSYGNGRVTATAIVAAWRASEDMIAAGNFEPSSQVGINNAFITYVPEAMGRLKLQWKFGVYPDRYGSMAEYDEGRYGTAVIGKIFGVGETLTADVELGGDVTLEIEHGVKGRYDKPPVGIVADNSNEFARPEQGATYAHHAHAGASWRDLAKLGLHYIQSFSQDDRALKIVRPVNDPTTPVDESQQASNQPLPDGSLRILGAEMSVRGGRFGRFYLGVSHARLDRTESLSGVVQVLNTGGGYNLMERLIGRNSRGTGSIFLVGSEYTVSLGKLTRYPEDFWGEGTDLLLGVFGMYDRTGSEDPAYDGVRSYKFGVEATYSALPWLAVSGRFDRLVPDDRHAERSFAIVSPKLIFRTNWQTRESVTLQYAKWFYGSAPFFEGDRVGLMNNPGQKLDDQMVAIYASMWW